MPDHAVLLAWKPPGQDSGEFLGHLNARWNQTHFSRKGIGHTGTLDPFAEGLLVVGLGEGTKLLTPMNGFSKSYRAEIVLGLSSDSLDPTGQIQIAESLEQKAQLLHQASQLSSEQLQTFLKNKIGQSEQVPPQFSAIHINGKRAYDLARKGESPVMKARPFELLEARHVGLQKGQCMDRECMLWTVDVHVSSGTYIRALARDWAQELIGWPGMLKTLVRTAVGPFSIQNPSELVLRLRDYEKIFDIRYLAKQEHEKLRRGGHLQARPQQCTLPNQARPQLLLYSNQIWGWCHAETGRIGRLLNEPIEIEA